MLFGANTALIWWQVNEMAPELATSPATSPVGAMLNAAVLVQAGIPLLVGVAAFIAGFGLVRTQPWARILAERVIWLALAWIGGLAVIWIGNALSAEATWFSDDGAILARGLTITVGLVALSAVVLLLFFVLRTLRSNTISGGSPR